MPKLSKRKVLENLKKFFKEVGFSGFNEEFVYSLYRRKLKDEKKKKYEIEFGEDWYIFVVGINYADMILYLIDDFYKFIYENFYDYLDEKSKKFGGNIFLEYEYILTELASLKGNLINVCLSCGTKEEKRLAAKKYIKEVAKREKEIQKLFKKLKEVTRIRKKEKEDLHLI